MISRTESDGSVADKREAQVVSDPQGESVIARVVRIIDSFDRSARSLPLGVLSRRAGIPIASTHRLVTEMVQQGLLERGPDRSVRLGARLWELSFKGSSLLPLREAALPHLEALMTSLRVHVNLSVLDNHSVLFLERLSYEGNIPAARTSERFAIHASSPGLVLLAFSDPAYQDFILESRPLEKVSRDTVTDPTILRSWLTEIRRTRIAYVPGIGIAEWTGIATPIFGVDGDVTAALSVIYPRGRERRAAASEALFVTARRIHDSLSADAGD